jgi:hypothetical protein
LADFPWYELAFHRGRYALHIYFDDPGQNIGVHILALRRAKTLNHTGVRAIFFPDVA